jgi:Inositol-pentakisphosphate 2-kinase
VQGRAAEHSRYDPLDLFSQEPLQRRAAIEALLETPQNNLALLVDGTQVQACKQDDQTAEPGLQLSDALEALFPEVSESADRRELLIDAIMVRVLPTCW